MGLLFVLLIGMSLSMPAAAQTSTATWTGAVFNNTTFTGTSVSRTDTNLALEFGTASPASGVNANNFSIRWTSTVSFATSGTYRFSLRADDSASLFLNNSSTPTLTTSGANVNAVTADVAITAGSVPMKVDYVEQVDNASIALTWTLISNTSGTATATSSPSTPVVTTGWTIQYFGGTTLSGPVLATIPISSPQLNWGTGSPNTSVPFDNFSARLTKAESFIPGVYRFEVRADDGVRVFVNGQKIIDRWTASDASQTYTADVAITGPSTIFIEYFELTNNASVYYTANRLPDGSIPSADAGSSAQPSSVVLAMSAQGRITAGTLNVREVPSTSGRVLTKVTFGQTYTVVGTNADRSWYQIRVAQFTGWVKSNFIRITQASVPVTAPTNFDLAVPNPVLPAVPAVVVPQAASTGYFLTATANVVMHNTPSTQSTRSGLVPMSAAAEILGRNSTNTWWYVTQNLQVGWISGGYVLLPANIDLSRIPVLQP